MKRQIKPIPEPVTQLQRQLDQFRRTHPRRTKLPEPLWQAAVELARRHGIYPVAHPLRLDYVQLEKRLGGLPVLCTSLPESRRRAGGNPLTLEEELRHGGVETFTVRIPVAAVVDCHGRNHLRYPSG